MFTLTAHSARSITYLSVFLPPASRHTRKSHPHADLFSRTETDMHLQLMRCDCNVLTNSSIPLVRPHCSPSFRKVAAILHNEIANIPSTHDKFAAQTSRHLLYTRRSRCVGVADPSSEDLYWEVIMLSGDDLEGHVKVAVTNDTEDADEDFNSFLENILSDCEADDEAPSGVSVDTENVDNLDVQEGYMVNSDRLENDRRTSLLPADTNEDSVTGQRLF